MSLDNWKPKLFRICTELVGLLLAILYIRGCIHKPVVPGPLPENDQEQIIVDPVKHHLTVVKPGKTQIFTLPDHTSVIDVHKDGSVQITSPQFGFEHRIFFGVMASDAFRLAVGLDGYYWKKLDLGIGFADQIGMHTPIVFAQVSYVIYDNLRLGITYDNRQHIGGSLTVRI